MTSGIYTIRNTITDARYIGASRDISARWNNHRLELARGVHTNPRLQSDWALYGESAFEFSIVEVVPDITLLAEREIHHIRTAGEVVIYNRKGSEGVGLNVQPSSIQLESRTFTLSHNDLQKLAQLVTWRHATDPRAASLTVRELIREAYERERARREGHEQEGEAAP